MLCRDVCHYCTFARPPRRGERAYLTVDEAVAIARQGAEAGCREALFTLGDKPELRYRAAREELASLGFETTAAYLAHVAGEVLRRDRPAAPREPGHPRRRRAARAARGLRVAGDHARDDLGSPLAARRRRTSARPTRLPSVRIDAIARAGRLRIPYTSGILIGIGETRRERVEALIALRDLHLEHGHLQEIIVQNFRAKAGTKMADAAEPTLDDHLWTIAVARLLLPPEVSVQAPPNLSGDDFPALLAAGIDDFGGISPVTPDHVNPEAPWPEVARLEAACAAAGLTLLPAPRRSTREYLADPETWLSHGTRGAALAASDGLGLARRERWTTGTVPEPPPAWRGGRRPQPVGGVSPAFERALERAETRALLDEDDATALLSRARARGRAARRRRRPPAPRARRRPCHLRRLPEHQLHERLLLQVRLLRLLEGQARREPARPRLPPERRRGRPARRRGLAARRHRGLPAGRDPPRIQRALVPRVCCARSRRRCRRSTCTRSRRSRSGRERRRRSGISPTT